MVIHPGILAQENPWTERGARQATVHGIRKELDMTEQLSSNKQHPQLNHSYSFPGLCSPPWHHLSHHPRLSIFFFFSFIFISWRLITSQHFSGFCYTLTWISHGVTCIPHPDPPSHLLLYPIPLGLPSAPDPSTCLMHPTWAGDLFHYR